MPLDQKGATGAIDVDKCRQRSSDRGQNKNEYLHEYHILTVKMYLILLCYFLAAICLLSPKNKNFLFNPENPLTIITSFFIHGDVLHYYVNIITLFTGSFFIEYVFRHRLSHLVLLAAISHIAASYTSHFYYRIPGCGCSAFIYSWVPIAISIRVTNLLGPTLLSEVLSITTITFLILADYCLDKRYYSSTFRFMKISHIGHLAGLLIGYLYWIFFLRLDIHKCASITHWLDLNSSLSLHNMFGTPNIPFYMNFHFIPFTLIYLYKTGYFRASPELSIIRRLQVTTS